MLSRLKQSRTLIAVTTMVIVAVVVLGFSSQVVSGPPQANASPDASSSTTFTTGWFGTFIDTLNPFESFSQLTGWINSNMYLPLVHYDAANGTVMPALATSWNVNYQNHTVIFNLNPNAVWSDGQAVTSQDVVYSYNIAAKNYTFVNSRVASMTNVSALTTHQVMFKFKGVIWEEFAAYIYVVPYHIWKSVNPKTYAGYNTNASKNGQPYFVGDGPFVMTDYVPNQYVKLEKNSKWFISSEQPKINTLIFQEFSSQSSAISSLQSGTIQGLSRVLPANLPKFQGNSKFNVSQSPPLEYLYLSFNLDPKGTGNPALRNLTLRQAVAHALNYKYIAQTVYHGYASPLGSVLSPNNNFYDHNLTPYSYNVSLANQMLNQTSFTMHSNGYRYNGTHELSFTIIVPSGDTEADNMATLIKTNLTKIGININVNAENTNSMAATIWQSNGTLGQDIDLWDWFDNSLAAPQLLSVFLSGQVVTGTSDSGFNNTTYDNLWNKLHSDNTTTPNAAKQVAYQMQAILYKQLPYIPLVAPSSVNVWSSSFKDINSSYPGGPFGGLDYLTFIQAQPNGTSSGFLSNNYVLYGIGAVIVVIVGAAVAVRIRGRKE